MSEILSTPNPEPSLYGDEPKAEIPRKAPGLVEQFTGVFTEPGELFAKLRNTPSWGWALGAAMTAGLVMIVAWGLKVDVDAMLRPMLEKNPQISSDQIDKIIEMQGRFILPFGIAQVLFMVPIISALMGLIYWLIGKGTAEGEKPSYLQAITVATVPGLIMVPQTLVTALMCLLKPVGGLPPDKIAPTSLGYFIATENPRLGAILFSLDPFIIGYFVVLYIAARKGMALKPLGAGLCTAMVVLFMVGFKIIFAR